MPKKSEIDEDAAAVWEALAREHGPDMATKIMNIGMLTPTKRKRQVPRVVGEKAKRGPALVGPREPGKDWRAGKAKSFQCRCGADGDDIEIHDHDTPSKPTYARCKKCDTRWHLTSSSRRIKIQ